MTKESNYLNIQYQNFFENSLSKIDPDIHKAITDELNRQQNHIELIASENIVSQAVLEAQGSVLTNKYAEGYPGKRYYGGCEHVDLSENLAIERAKKLFDCKYANVQPHSGAQANGAVYLALIKPGDKITKPAKITLPGGMSFDNFELHRELDNPPVAEKVSKSASMLAEKNPELFKEFEQVYLSKVVVLKYNGKKQIFPLRIEDLEGKTVWSRK